MTLLEIREQSAVCSTLRNATHASGEAAGRSVGHEAVLQAATRGAEVHARSVSSQGTALRVQHRRVNEHQHVADTSMVQREAIAAGERGRLVTKQRLYVSVQRIAPNVLVEVVTQNVAEGDRLPGPCRQDGRRRKLREGRGERGVCGHIHDRSRGRLR